MSISRIALVLKATVLFAVGGRATGLCTLPVLKTLCAFCTVAFAGVFENGTGVWYFNIFEHSEHATGILYFNIFEHAGG